MKHHYTKDDSIRTIYRKCQCGETAHDPKAGLVEELNPPSGAKVDGAWVHYYVCRNCRRRTWIKA